MELQLLEEGEVSEALERYKAKLDFWKFLLGSGLVAIAVAAIPPLFQYATKSMEIAKAEAELKLKAQTDRDNYVKEFVTQALNQNIELRIRLADYFAALATEPSRAQWLAYRESLHLQRESSRKHINELEDEFRRKNKKDETSVVLDSIDRRLKWAHDEVGYVQKVVTIDPAAMKQESSAVIPANMRVFFQFAGTLRREEVRAAMERTRAQGWNVQGVSGGGERIAAASGYNEVRYGPDDDLLAAQLLATTLQGPDYFNRRIGVVKNSDVKKSELEVWVSR